jgi:outer membrane protein TolC
MLQRPVRSSLAAIAALCGISFSSIAAGQPQPAQPGQPAAQPAAPPRAVATLRDPIAEELAAKPGGLTPDQAGSAAARSSPGVRVKEAELRAAAARVDQALVGYFPKVTLTATYTRLSETQSDLGGGSLVGAGADGPIRVAPCPPGLGPGDCAVDSAGNPIAATSVSFASPLNSYSVVASLIVPVSDYALRLVQTHRSAKHAERGKRLEVEAEKLARVADAKIVFYNWVRARGQLVVAKEAIVQAQAHVRDAKAALDVGRASNGDVMRLEAQVASAEQVEAEAQAQLAVAEAQLRTAMHLPADRPLAIGVDVLADRSAADPGPLDALMREAMTRRLELRALDESSSSSREAESVARAGYFPRLDGFADLTFANPNQRVFPQQDQWDTTWALGARLTWVVNDTFTAAGATAEARARTAAVAEQKAALVDAVRLEVAAAWADVRKAGPTISAAERGLAAALEAERIQLELLAAGRSSGVAVVDAQTEVTRARLRKLDAQIGAQAARTRLDHAVGRDVAAPSE